MAAKIIINADNPGYFLGVKAAVYEKSLTNTFVFLLLKRTRKQYNLFLERKIEVQTIKIMNIGIPILNKNFQNNEKVQ